MFFVVSGVAQRCFSMRSTFSEVASPWMVLARAVLTALRVNQRLLLVALVSLGSAVVACSKNRSLGSSRYTQPGDAGGTTSDAGAGSNDAATTMGSATSSTPDAEATDGAVGSDASCPVLASNYDQAAARTRSS
jgi:hypothetical protein